MGRRTSGPILVSGMFLLLVVIAADVTAQTSAAPPSSGGPHAQSPNVARHRVAFGNPACRRIVNECTQMGFIEGQWKKDNGLWKDCFDPIVKGGGSPTRYGKPIDVPVSSSDVEDCRAALESHHRGEQ